MASTQFQETFYTLLHITTALLWRSATGSPADQTRPDLTPNEKGVLHYQGRMIKNSFILTSLHGIRILLSLKRVGVSMI